MALSSILTRYFVGQRYSSLIETIHPTTPPDKSQVSVILFKFNQIGFMGEPQGIFEWKKTINLANTFLDWISRFSNVTVGLTDESCGPCFFQHNKFVPTSVIYLLQFHNEASSWELRPWSSTYHLLLKMHIKVIWVMESVVRYFIHNQNL